MQRPPFPTLPYSTLTHSTTTSPPPHPIPLNPSQPPDHLYPPSLTTTITSDHQHPTHPDNSPHPTDTQTDHPSRSKHHKSHQLLIHPPSPSAHSISPELVHRVVMGVHPTRTSRPVQRERIDDRPGPGLEMELVERPEHSFAMRDGRHSILRNRRRLPGHLVRRPRGAPADRRASPTPARFHRRLEPATEIPRLDPTRPIPPDVHRSKESPPPQQIHSIRTDGGRRPARRQQLPKEHADRFYDRTRRIPQLIWLAHSPRRLHQSADPGHDEPHQVPPSTPINDHAGKLAGTPTTPVTAC